MARQITLVVEDGTGVSGANSFVSENDIVAYAAARGVTLPGSSDAELDAVAVLGIKAMDYLRALSWRGEPVDPDQPLPWPRKNFSGQPSSDGTNVPSTIAAAQLALTMYAQAGTDLTPSSTGAGLLIKEKIGPIENQYSAESRVTSDGLPIFPAVTGLLKSWLLGDTEGFLSVGITSIGGRDQYGC